jgi:hypothetical protein
LRNHGLCGRDEQDYTSATMADWIAEARISEEPGAVVPHAGTCAGAVG